MIKLDKIKSNKKSEKNINFKNNKEIIYNIENNNEENNMNNQNYNLSPYTMALREDRRNYFQIITSYIFEKIELLNLFKSDENFRQISICEYILSLLLDFFFNTLLYSDEIVSHKYHNNGKLQFVITFILSLLSNVISSIICHYIKFSERLEEKKEELLKIRNEYKYLKIFQKFLKEIKIRFICFIIVEIIIIIFCFYYIVIFFIVYAKSQKSLFINYLTSLLEGLIKSIIVITLIVTMRIIGINCRNVYIFNTSKYIDQYF